MNEDHLNNDFGPEVVEGEEGVTCLEPFHGIHCSCQPCIFLSMSQFPG
jgi:hypothetical protein